MLWLRMGEYIDDRSRKERMAERRVLSFSRRPY